MIQPVKRVGKTQSPVRPKTKAEYRSECRKFILGRIRDRKKITADDVRSAVAVPEGVSPSILGSVFVALSRDKLIVLDSYAVTERRIAHSRICRVWRASPAGQEG